MQLVVFLSGKVGRTLGQYNTRDSIAASIQIPKEMEKDFIESVECRGSAYLTSRRDEEPLEELVLAAKDSDIVPYIVSGELDDLLSDMLNPGPDQEHPFYTEVLEHIIRCEASCGYVHVLKK